MAKKKATQKAKSTLIVWRNDQGLSAFYASQQPTEIHVTRSFNGAESVVLNFTPAEAKTVGARLLSFGLEKEGFGGSAA